MKTSSSSFSPPAGALLHRQCACGNRASVGGECERCRAQRQSALTGAARVSEPTDVHEQEADRVADQVSAAGGATPLIRPLAGERTAPGGLPASVDRAVARPGRPLDPELRHDMERRFGHDFSRVRVHSDAPAEQSAHEVAADAYTLGHNIVFGAGQYAPATPTGRRLLAHELTHVVQGRGATERAPGATQATVLMRQPTRDKGEASAVAADTDPCTASDPLLPEVQKAEAKQRQAILQDMLRGTTADEKRDWCKGLRRAMAAFSLSQLTALKAAGVRFWRVGEFPPPFKGEFAPAEAKRFEMARYQPNTRVIQWGPKAGVDEIRHELAHAWDHVRGGKVARLDAYKGARLKGAVTADTPFASEATTKRLTIEESVGGERKKVRLSIPDMFDRFMQRPALNSSWSFANTRTDPEHVLTGVKEFYAEGYSVFHSGNADAQAQLLCDAPELYQMLEVEANAAKLPVPERSTLDKNNQDNRRKCSLVLARYAPHPQHEPHLLT